MLVATCLLPFSARFRRLAPLTVCLITVSALLFSPSAGAGAPETVQFCGANQVCVQASNLALTPGGEWLRGVDVTVQLKLAAPITQVELKSAAIFSTHHATVHVGKWSQTLATPLHFDDDAATFCTDSPCTELTDSAQFVLHFVLRLPANFPPGYHVFWLSVPGGENGQTLSSPKYGYATPLPKPKATYHLSGDTLTIRVSSVAFQLATPKLPVTVWATAQRAQVGAIPIASATAGDSVTLRHPVKTVTLTVKFRPAGHWYLGWVVQPLYSGDGRFDALDGPQREYHISG